MQVLSVTILSEGLVAFIMGMISVVAVIGALPMFEAIFEFVTPMQLLEMTNPNQPILKRLLLEDQVLKKNYLMLIIKKLILVN